MEAYVYEDTTGLALFRVVRRGGKRFAQQSKGTDGKWHAGLNGAQPTLYRLPQVRRAVLEGRTVYVVEGEKDVHTAESLGVCATTNPGGAGKWRREYAELLAGADVVIVWDRDGPGRKHALSIGESLSGVARRIRYMRAAQGKDLTDHVLAGFGLKNLTHVKPKISTDPGTFSVQVDEFLPAAFQLVLNRLAGVTVEAGKTHQYNARCPAHDDSRASLSVRLGGPGEPVVLLYCHAGCDPRVIARELGINMPDLSYAQDPQETGLKGLAKKRFDAKVAEFEANQAFQSTRLSNIVEIESAPSAEEQFLLPDVPTPCAIDDLLSTDGNGLLVAKRKAGKTRLALTLLKQFCDREPFLGAFSFNAPTDARVLYLNYEMSQFQFIRWFKATGVTSPDNAEVMHVRGRSLPFWLPEVRERLVRFCHARDIWFLIIDPQLMAMIGAVASENDIMEVARWQDSVSVWRRAAGVEACLITHHEGKAAESGGRGASQIEAWPDDIWYLGSDSENASSDRTFHYVGRAGEDFSGALLYDDGTGLYRYEGQSAVERAAEGRLKAYLARLRDFELSDGHHYGIKETLKLCGAGAQARRIEVHKECLRMGYVELRAEIGSATRRVYVTDHGLAFLGAYSVGSGGGVS